MNSDQFEKRMRAFECYHNIQIVPWAWIVLRMDGVGFSKLTERLGLQKPFDLAFANIMTFVSEALLTRFGGLYVYHQSDEISLLLKPESTLYDRELEKLVSTSAGLASAHFATQLHDLTEWPFFDCRVCVLPTRQDVLDYFSWRQSDSIRNALNSYAFWIMVEEMSSGKSNLAARRSAAKFLERMSVADKRFVCSQNDLDFDAVPAWQRNGTGIHWQEIEREGYNPKTNEKVLTTRRVQYIERELPARQEYRTWLLKNIINPHRGVIEDL